MAEIFQFTHSPHEAGTVRDAMSAVPIPRELQEAVLEFDPEGTRGGPEILDAYQAAVYKGRDARDALASAVKRAHSA